MEPEQRTLIVAAHPDDEIIGAGIWMARHAHQDRIFIAHVTDGSPRLYPDHENYARLRRSELLLALGLAGILPDQCLELGFADQEAYLHLAELADRIRALIDKHRPQIILTHPYEGGHPDHDAAAFAVAQVTHGRHREFTSYHREDGEFVTGKFLPARSSKVETLELAPAERELKRAMLESFATQQEILKLFAIEHERFRFAPRYDFTKAPHGGELQYERWGFADGAEWRRRAAEALNKMKNQRAIA